MHAVAHGFRGFRGTKVEFESRVTLGSEWVADRSDRVIWLVAREDKLKVIEDGDRVRCLDVCLGENKVRGWRHARRGVTLASADVERREALFTQEAAEVRGYSSGEYCRLTLIVLGTV